jgi:hypothetical protein
LLAGDTHITLTDFSTTTLVEAAGRDILVRSRDMTGLDLRAGRDRGTQLAYIKEGEKVDMVSLVFEAFYSGELQQVGCSRDHPWFALAAKVEEPGRAAVSGTKRQRYISVPARFRADQLREGDIVPCVKDTEKGGRERNLRHGYWTLRRAIPLGERTGFAVVTQAEGVVGYGQIWMATR